MDNETELKKRVSDYVTEYYEIEAKIRLILERIKLKKVMLPALQKLTDNERSFIKANKLLDWVADEMILQNV